MSAAATLSGFGLGLRHEHYTELLEGGETVRARIGWLEALTENYLVPGGRPLHYLDQMAERWPLVLHGVSLSIGSTDPLDQAYLDRLAALIGRVEPVHVSDHLCWTGVAGWNSHDLLPLPQTEEAIIHVADRVLRVQDRLKRRILLENPSSYVAFAENQVPEAEFLAAIAERADCGLLLDVNNVHVSGFNHGFDPLAYLAALPAARVAYIHLAGHDHQGSHIIDTHDHPIADPVWDLYQAACRRFGPVPAMIERDDHIPPLAELLDELDLARARAAAA